MKAVILAGGLGQRLRPLTEILPKPLLPVGESSVLEIQIRSLKKAGFTHVFVATHYMADSVEEALGDGSQFGLRITISREEKPLGTCGPLSLLKGKLNEPFLLMNGDILTTLKFDEFMRVAKDLDADLTVATKKLSIPFEFGVAVTAGDYLFDVHEKPEHQLEILTGIYAFKPEIFRLIPSGTYFGIDSLIKNMIRDHKSVGRYLMTEYWLDIGHVNNYKLAQDSYKYFDHLKPQEDDKSIQWDVV